MVKIISASEHELGGFFVLYSITEDSSNQIPYHLEDKASGVFASEVRSCLKDFSGDIKTLEQVIQEFEDGSSQQEIAQEERRRQKKEAQAQKEAQKLEYKKKLASAIVSGDEKAIFEALSFI